MTHVLRSASMTAEELATEARHLRTLAGLATGEVCTRQAWGVAEVVDAAHAPRHALQVGETVLIAPHAAEAERVMVHSKVRGDDIYVPRRCVHVVLAPEAAA